MTDRAAGQETAADARPAASPAPTAERPPGREPIAYESPEAVLADEGLDVEQKRRFLTAWADELRAHASEGTAAPDDARPEATLLERIRRTIATLAETS
jgi:hypothetical protein